MELQRKTIYVGNSYNGYARHVPIILDAICIERDINGNRSKVRTVLRKEQVYDSNYAFSDNNTSYINGIKRDYPGKMYFGTETIQTYEYWVNHNEEGKASAYINASLNTAWGSVSLSGTLPLEDIPRGSKLTTKDTVSDSAESFNVDNFKLEMTITKYVENYVDNLEICMYSKDDTRHVIKTIENIQTGFIYEPTEDEKNSIYSIMFDTKERDLYLELSTYNNGTQIGSTYKTKILAKVIDANPVFTDFIITDTNEITYNLTGERTALIKGYSNCKINVSGSNLAVGQKGATITKYQMVIGEEQIDINNSDNVEHTFNKVSNNQIVVIAIDSRGNQTQVIKYPDRWINYTKPVIKNIDINRNDNGISEYAVLEFDGTFSNINFGKESNNLQIEAYYTVYGKEEWVLIDNLTANINDTIFSFNNQIKGDLSNGGFILENAYQIRIKVIDKLDNDYEEATLQNGKPNIAIHQKGVSFGEAYDENSEFQAQFEYKANFKNGIYENGKRIGGDSLPIGSMMPCGSSKDIPSNWKICDGSAISRTTYADLFNVIGTSYGEGDGSTTFNLPNKKGRVSVGLDVDQSEFNSIGKKSGSKYMQKHSHKLGNEGAWYYGASTANLSGTGTWAYRAYQTNEAGEGDSGNLQPYEVDVWIIKVSNVVSSLEETAGTIIDNLTSTSLTDALSANMGRELNEKHNWKLHSTTTGTGTTTLPTDYNELYIEVSSSGSTDPIISLYVPKASLTSSNRTFRKGYYFNSSVHGAVASVISLTTYRTADLYISGAVHNSKASSKIYYR